VTTPVWALTLAYWLHMCATVIWIGGLAAMAVFILPAAHQTLSAQSFLDFLNSVQSRLDRWGWFSLIVLAATGMLQLSANPNYDGFLAVDNRWAIAILVKHIAFLGMAGVSAYLTWGIMPKIRRAVLRRASKSGTGNGGAGDSPETSAEMAGLQRQELWLLRLNLVLGIVVLGLTAVARAV
jgi:uncharacterized membrane protein